MFYHRKKRALTIIEILVSAVIGVVLLGIVYTAYYNVSEMNNAEQLEGEFKQKINTSLQDMRNNIENSFAKTACFNTTSGTLIYNVSPVLSRKIYDTTKTNDTISIFSSSGTCFQGGTLYKTYITYGLKRLTPKDPNFPAYALYKRVQETGLTNGTPPAGVDPNSSTCKTLIGYYKNKKNYLAVSKLGFTLKGNDVVNISIQLVGAKSRGAGTVVKAIYKPDAGLKFYTTSVQIKVGSGQTDFN